jgi:hypothetical protein
MDTDILYFTLMLIPLLAGRSMTAVFTGSFYTFLHKHGHLEKIEAFDFIELDVDALQIMAGLPEFVTSPMFLIVMAVLAVVEKRISQSPSFQDIWVHNEAKIKGTCALVITFFMFDETSNQIINSVFAASPDAPSSSDNFFLRLENAWTAFIGFSTWLLTAIRSSILRFLIEADHDDTMGVRRFIGRLEGLLGIFGPLVFIILPVIAVSFVGIAFGIMGLLKWRVRQVEKRHEQPCPNCQHNNHMSAPHCGNCNATLTNVRDVGFMGLSKMAVPALEEKLHLQRLLQANRCSYCAGKSSNQGISSHCKTCDRMLFANKEAVDIYLKNVRKKLPITFLVTSACGFFPIIGLIPGIIFYRLYLISNLKVYVHSGSGFFIRILLRIFFLILILWNMTPFFGFVSIPIMAFANYVMYSQSIRNQLYSVQYKQAVEKSLAKNSALSVEAEVAAVPVEPEVAQAPAEQDPMLKPSTP